MGYWNETCGLSQMPIKGGDPVVAVLITNNFSGNLIDLSYSTDLWSPISLPFRGDYNDYGGVEKVVEDITTKLLYKALTKGFKFRRSQYGDYKDVHLQDDKVDLVERDHEDEEHIYTLDNAPEDFTDFINDVVERGGWNAQIPDRNAHIYDKPADSRVNCVIGLWMCHAWAWDKFCDMGWKSCYNGQEVSLDTYQQHGSSFYKEELKIHSIDKNDESMLHKRRELIDMNYDDIHNNFFKSIFGSGMGSLVTYQNGPSILNVSLHILMDFIKKQTPVDDENVSVMIKKMSEMAMVHLNMGRMRKLWSPQTGKGSQSDEIDPYSDWFTTLLSKVEEKQLRNGVSWNLGWSKKLLHYRQSSVKSNPEFSFEIKVVKKEKSDG